MQYKDYYQTLGVSRDADQDEIKRAYRKLARKYHPDVSKESNAEERFKEVGEAYEVLKDAERRATYDQLGSGWHAGDEFNPPPDWESRFNVRREFGGGAGFDFSDFFEGLFGGVHRGGAGRTGRAPRGGDERLRISIALEDAYRGAERTLQLRRPELDASGRVAARTQTIKVKIPVGVTQGQQIRLAGQGQSGMGGGASGDLYLEVEFEPHRLFRAEGKDIYVDLPITPWEAALGATVKVPTLGGKVDLKLPAGSQSGGKLRLKGRGLGGKSPGDQYVVLQMVAPRADTESAKALYERMARELNFDPRAKLG